MIFKDTCEVSLGKNTKKVKCFKFKNKELNRELALHEDVDNKTVSSVTDTITGYRLFAINKKADTVKETDIQEKLEVFIKHFTLKEIAKEFKKKEEIEKSKGRKLQ